MHEDRPEKDTPLHVSAMLLQYGGRVPDGRPLWRMVLAQNCRLQCFGVMNHAPRVSDDCDEREIQPERRQEGEFWIPRYRKPGWVLQRWRPPSTWGSKAEWERERAQDGVTRLRGKFPENGDYVTLAGPWPSIELAGDLRLAIQQLQREEQNNPTNYERYLAEQVREDLREREEAVERFELTLEEYRQSHVLPMLKSTSQSAQRVRNKLQASLGVHSHLGASETY